MDFDLFYESVENFLFVLLYLPFFINTSFFFILNNLSERFGQGYVYDEIIIRFSLFSETPIFELPLIHLGEIIWSLVFLIIFIKFIFKLLRRFWGLFGKWY